MDRLLEVQAWDVKRDNHLQRLASLPRELAALEKKTTATQNALKQWREEHRRLQTCQQELEKQIQAAEAKIKHYQTQQLSVQKEDAWQALDHEIAALREHISTWEDEGIALLLRIDESEAAGEVLSTQTQSTLAQLQTQIDTLREQENAEQQQTPILDHHYQEACAHIDTEALDTYQTVKARVKRPPYIVPLDDHQCTGCHLRVSRDIVEQATLNQGLIRCDQCGRIVYRPVQNK